jgi:hypothetical protein
MRGPPPGPGAGRTTAGPGPGGGAGCGAAAGPGCGAACGTGAGWGIAWGPACGSVHPSRRAWPTAAYRAAAAERRRARAGSGRPAAGVLSRREPSRTDARLGAMLPAIAIVEPRAIAVIAVPVRADREPGDRYADDRAVFDQRHVVALVGIVELLRVDPAAHARQRDVAPRVVAQTAEHVHRGAGRKLRDHRIVGCRPGIERRDRVRVGAALRGGDARRRGDAEQDDAQTSDDRFAHGALPRGSAARPSVSMAAVVSAAPVPAAAPVSAETEADRDGRPVPAGVVRRIVRGVIDRIRHVGRRDINGGGA